MNSVGSLTADGQSRIHVGNVSTVNVNLPGTHERDRDSSLLSDLYVTEPFNDLQFLKRKKGNRVGGTCEWILATKELISWMGSSNVESSSKPPCQILWLHGSPGRGKSTIAMYITDALTTSFVEDSKKALCYFFCDSSYATRKTAQSILRGLLWHIYSSYPELVPDYVRKRHREMKERSFEGFDSLWAIFMETVKKNPDHHFFCLIDALDECDEDSREDLLSQIEETFGTLGGPLNINFLILSRPYVQIQDHLGQFENKDLALFPQLNQDIDRYIDYELEKLAKIKRYSQTLRGKIRTSLQAKAEGTFLWVGLACRELRRLASVDVMKVLDGFPVELKSLYSRIFDSLLTLNESESADNIKILRFVAVSVRPLTLLELSEACRFDTGEDTETRTQYMRDRVNKCQLIVDIVRAEERNVYQKKVKRSTVDLYTEELEGERVVLLHQSVKDFMFASLPTYFVGEALLNATMAYRCLDELIHRLSAKHRYFLKKKGLLQYATCYWPYHARIAGASFKVQDVHENFFSDPSLIRDEWLSQRGQYTGGGFPIWHSIESKLPLLNVAALWAIPSLVDYVSATCSNGLDIPEGRYDSQSTALKSPLVDAIEGGCDETLRRLLAMNLPLTEFSIESAARQGQEGKALRTLLMERQGEIVRKPSLQKAAAEFLNPFNMLGLMSHQDFEITEALLNGAIINKSHGPEMLALFLDQCEEDVTICESILSQTMNHSCLETVEFLFDRYGEKLEIDSSLITKAADSFDGSRLIDFLLTRRPDIHITDEIMLDILALETPIVCTHRVLKVLFDRIGSELVTERVLIGAAQAWYEDDEDATVFKIVMENADEDLKITHDVIMAVAENTNAWAALPWLLSRRGTEIVISEEIWCAAIPNLTVDVFLSLYNASEHVSQVTEKMIIAAAGAWEIDDFLSLWKLAGPNNQTSQEMLVAACSNLWCGPKVLMFLLETNLNFDAIDSKVLEAVLRTKSGLFMFALLHQRGDMIRLNKDLLQIWMREKNLAGESLQVLLKFKAAEVDTILDEMSTAERTEFENQRRELFQKRTR